jgi:integrating conjugative element protein (TIGR03759 family)
MNFNKAMISLILSSTLLKGVYAVEVKPLDIDSIEINKTDTLLSKKGVDEALDDIYDDQDIENIKLTPKQLHEAKVWGLSVEEEKRYLALMQNKAGSFYKRVNHSPVDILGINARNDEERNHFAKLAAEQEIVRVAKELAWNTAFTNLSKKVSNNKNVISDFDTSKYSPRNHNQYVLTDKDVLHLFITKDDASMTLMSSLLDAVKQATGSKIIIYLVDAENEEAQIWANKNAISLDMVRKQKIIIKIGPDNFNALGISERKTPLLLLSRGGQSKIMSFGGRNV